VHVAPEIGVADVPDDVKLGADEYSVTLVVPPEVGMYVKAAGLCVTS
jgi:hypothetical protein